MKHFLVKPKPTFYNMSICETFNILVCRFYKVTKKRIIIKIHAYYAMQQGCARMVLKIQTNRHVLSFLIHLLLSREDRQPPSYAVASHISILFAIAAGFK